MANDPALADAIRAKFLKSEQRVKRAESALEKAKLEHEELAVTMRTLVRHGLIPDDEAPALTGTPEMNEDQQFVLSAVPKGEPFAVTPKEIIESLWQAGHLDLSGDYIRTTLWRFAKRGVLKSDSGRYWWPSAAVLAENVAAPDAETSEADNGAVGPRGGGSGFPPSAPEGSNPSGSTQPWKIGDPIFDDDDDAPF